MNFQGIKRLRLILVAILSTIAGGNLLHAQDFNGDGLPDPWSQAYGYPTNTLASPSGLIGWWQVNSSTGSLNAVMNRTAYSLEGSFRTNGKSIKGTYVPGLFGNALKLNPTNYVYWARSPVLDTTNGFTMSLYYKGSSASQPSSLVRWLGRSGTTTNIWNLKVEADGRASLGMHSGNLYTNYLAGGSGEIRVRDNDWHHIVATYNKGNTNARVYVNGVLQFSKSMPWPSFVLTNQQSFIWGVFPSTTTQPGFEMDEARLYNRALSSSEIKTIPVTYYDLDGDGLSTLDEYNLGTDPKNADTDGDGIPDGADSTPGSAVASVLFSHPSGTYTNQTLLITLSCGTPGATIRYDSDGTEADAHSAIYTGPFVVPLDEYPRYISARAFKSGVASPETSRTYKRFKVATPQISPSTENHPPGSVLNVTIGCATANAQVFWRTNGIPFTLYGGGVIPVKVPGSIYSRATYPDWIDSDESSMHYQVAISPWPTANPAGGQFLGPVTVSFDYPGDVYYTLDGTVPDITSTRYTGPFVVEPFTQVRAIGVQAGKAPSNVVGWNYELKKAPGAHISPSEGGYAEDVEVTISSGYEPDRIRAGREIFYTLDGSTPTIHSIRYIGPFMIRGSVLIKAFTTQAGYLNSDPDVAQYYLYDSDFDGMTDAFENAHGLNPNSASDATLDPDGDGRTNVQEYLQKSNPVVKDHKLTVIAHGGTVAGGTSGNWYPDNTVLSLSPSPNTGFVFNKWGSPFSGTASPVSLNMVSNSTVSLFFTDMQNPIVNVLPSPEYPGDTVLNTNGFNKTSIISTNLTYGGTATASSTTAGGYTAAGAFDKVTGGSDLSKRWRFSVSSGYPQWIRYDFGSGKSKKIQHYRIYSGSFTSRPKSWSFEGSQNGTSWIILDKRTERPWKTSSYNAFQIYNPVAYRYYRLVITEANSTSDCTIEELELCERQDKYLTSYWGGTWSGEAVDASPLTLTWSNLMTKASGQLPVLTNRWSLGPPSYYSNGDMKIGPGTNVIQFTAMDQDGNEARDYVGVFRVGDGASLIIKPNPINVGTKPIGTTTDIPIHVEHPLYYGYWNDAYVKGDVSGTTPPFSFPNGSSYEFWAGRTNTLTLRVAPSKSGVFTNDQIQLPEHAFE
jgi:hypothetical protein